MYALIRAIAGMALRWFYRDIQVDGLERIPRDRALLLVVNHPNALVDALLVGWVVPRRVLITAKSTLFANPIADRALRWLGVVPLRRASDESASGAPQRLDPARNLGTFRAVHDALRDGGCVLIFPEGKTHDEPSLAPLKTGAARMALHARDAGDVPGPAVVPIGLTFERKDAPRSRALVQVGEPIFMDEWRAPQNAPAAEALTHEIDARLRAVTSNYATPDDAARAIRLARVIAALFEPVPEIGVVDRALGAEIAIARRIDALSTSLARSDAALRTRIDDVVLRLEATERTATNHGVLLEDARISLTARSGARFVGREGLLLLTAGPVALWGRLNHWIPFRAARAVALRNVDSAADPAMRTLVSGTAFVLLAYLVQTLVVAALWGGIAGGVYLIGLPIAAETSLYFGDRLRRAVCRARAFLLFRRDPQLRQQLLDELAFLRNEVVEIDRELRSSATLTAV
ncbi:MAG TPA: lysophospholipid acyltransferase family protein [Gemmatimonadaceae bacterium]|nr:lysophospholipid acyltransferase family protein [Gemmatimonadaceae bacterium]